MDIGIHFSDFTLEGGDAAIPTGLAELAKTADEVGFERLTVMDHWFQIDPIGPVTDPMLEAYTALGYVAGVTERLKLGTLVTGITYRHPGLLVKTATTLDVLSRGRALFGVGAAWFEREHAGLGVPYPPLAERFERLEETIRIARQMWSDDEGPFIGKHYRLEETICRPRPVRGRMPILIGGSGERKTLRLVAEYADECNLFAADVDTVRHKIDVLKAHCEDVGRDPAEVRVTMIAQGDPAKDPAGFIDRMRDYAALGVTQVQVRDPRGGMTEWARAVGRDVIPRLAEL